MCLAGYLDEVDDEVENYTHGEVYHDKGKRIVTVDLEIPSSAMICKYSVTVKKDGSYCVTREW